MVACMVRTAIIPMKDNIEKTVLSFINFISAIRYTRYKNCNKTEDMQSALMCKAHVGARRT